MDTVATRCYLAMLTTLVLWASAFAAIHRALVSFSPYHLALFRFLVASAVFGVIALRAKIRFPRRGDRTRIALTGLVGIGVYHSALNCGQQWVTAGATSFIVNTVPIFTGLFAAALLRERVTRARWLGIALSFSGIALIVLGEGMRVGGGRGAWLILLAAISQSLLFILQKPLLQRYTATELTCYAIWSGTACLAIFLPGLGRELRQAPPTATMVVVYLGIFPAAIANLCWTFVLAQMPASRAASYLYLVPPLSLLFAWLWLGEFPSALSLAGCGLALGGVIAGNAAAKRSLVALRSSRPA